MSLLADSCAGETRARVTDRAAAYANITNLLITDKQHAPHGAISEDLVVPVTLELINTSDISLDELISFREREEKPGGYSLAELRHNYADSIENLVSSLKQPSLSQADRKELRRQFQSKMQNDLRALRQELKLAGTKFVFSTAVVTGIVAAGVVAADALGMSLVFPAAVTSASGVAMGVGASSLRAWTTPIPERR